MSPEIQRETKAQKVERQRIEQRAQEAHELRNLQTRRLLLKGGLAATGVAGTAALGLNYFVNSSSKPEITSSLDVVDQEIKKLGIVYSQKEFELWNNNLHSPAKTPVPASQIDMSEVRRRTDLTGNLMNQSENPYFKEAIQVAYGHINTKNLSLQFERFVPGKPNVTLYVLPAIFDGSRFGVTINVSGDVVINRFDLLMFALGLTHEVEHVRNFFNLGNPNLSARDRFDAQNRRIDNYQEALEEEGRGYAKETLAYIYHRGLTDLKERSSPYYERATEFLKSNKDPKSTRWFRYIESIGFR